MNKYKFSALMSSLILIALFGVGCGSGISDKNRKILNDETLFKSITDSAEKNAKNQAVFQALVDVITVDFDTRKVAEGAEKARYSFDKLEKKHADEEENKASLAKIAAMPDTELRQKVKKALEGEESAITVYFSELKMPKNVLIGLESLSDFNSIWPEAKTMTRGYIDVIKLLSGKLSHVPDLEQQDEIAEALLKFLYKLDRSIVEGL
jgi:hypothetical protein